MLQRWILFITAGLLALVSACGALFDETPKDKLRIFFSSELSGYITPCG